MVQAFERCIRVTRDRRSSVLRKDEITIKNYLFLSHKDHEIFKKWESNASHHFLFIREEKKSEICHDLDILYTYIKQTLNVRTKYIQQRDQILQRANNDLLKILRNPLSQKTNNPLQVCDLFEIHWAEWSSGIRGREEEVFTVDILGDLKETSIDCLGLLELSHEERELVLNIELHEYEEFGKMPFKLCEVDYYVHDQSTSYVRQAFTMAYKLLKRPIEWFKDSRPFDNSTKNDATTQKIYHFVNTTSSRVTEYVQSLNQSHPYSISYFGKIFSIVFTQIDSFNKKEEQQAYQRIILNPIFVLTISLHQCCRAIPHFRNIHEEFMRHNSIDAQLAKIKTELEAIFMSYCQGQVEFSCISKLSCIMFEGMRNLLSTILNEEIVSLFRDDSDHGDIFKKRSSLQIQVLKELANKENFDDYISYILDPISFFTNWIKNQMSVYCSRETVVDKIHSTILRPKIESFSRDYCTLIMLYCRRSPI